MDLDHYPEPDIRNLVELQSEGCKYSHVLPGDHPLMKIISTARSCQEILSKIKPTKFHRPYTCRTQRVRKKKMLHLGKGKGLTCSGTHIKDPLHVGER